MSKGNKTTSDSTALTKLRQIATLVQACIEDLETQPSAKGGSGRRLATPSSHAATIDFDTNVRNFVRTHGTRLTGSRKFVLLLAYLAKGESNKQVQLKDIERLWNKMTALLDGGFNRKYSNDAKEKGWVNTTKQGQYVLQRTWRDIFTKP